MGKGAYLSVTNTLAEPVSLVVSNKHCMYDNGADGSHLSYFDGLVVSPGQTMPNPRGQYIEVKASSSGGDFCATDPSTFDVEIMVGDSPLGTAKVTEHDFEYQATSTNADHIAVAVAHGSDDTIHVTVR